MLSLFTCIELRAVVDGYDDDMLDEIYAVFDWEYLVRLSEGRCTKQKKLNILLKELKYGSKPGPFSSCVKLDLLQYLVNHFYRGEDAPSRGWDFEREKSTIPYDERFSSEYPSLANSVKRDGYLIKGRLVKKMLPEEIEEAKTESELFNLLTKFKLDVSRGHLQQAIDNHSQSNWAGANAQFRSFIESLFMGISQYLLPGEKCPDTSTAFNLLTNRTIPAFLQSNLNEVEHVKCKKPFLEGFWKRLHPAGSHPGLSDEEDCSFRYHLSIVVALNLLKRLEKRKP